MWTFRGDSQEAQPVRTEHLEGQLPCMVATREMRMVRLHLERGAFATPVRLQVPADPAQKDAVLTRYESKQGDLAIRPGEDVIVAAARWFTRAKRVLVTDGEHLPFVLLVLPDGTSAIHTLHVPDRQALYVTMRQIAHE